jgi:hypothetical protein
VDADLISWLQNWYAAWCDGDWEHSYGVKIETIDNPGWTVAIDLVGTTLEGARFEAVDDRWRSEDDWVDCRVEDNCFRGAGGPYNLLEILHIFREWVVQQEN